MPITVNLPVTVVAKPTGLTAVASAPAVCSGSTITLTGSAATTNTLVSENFEGATFAPTGWTLVNAGSGNNWSQSTSTSLYPFNHTPGGSKSMRYIYNGTNVANAWSIMPGQTLTAGVTYTLSFWYGSGYQSTLYTEKLKVTVGNAATVASQTTTLFDNPSVASQSPYVQQTVTFTPTATGTYFFGFNCYSATNQSYLDVDDVLLTVPTTLNYEWAGTPSATAGIPGAAQTAAPSNNTAIVSPTATTTYTVIATNASGCTSSASTSAITVDPVTVAGTVSPATNCHPTATNSGTITLAGSVGTILRWESATNAAFTGTVTTIANPTNALNYTNVAATTYYRAVLKSGSCNQEFSTVAEVKVGGCESVLTLTQTFIEGYMNAAGTAMVPVFANAVAAGGTVPGVASPTATQCDYITIELHDATAPYALAFTKTVILNTDGSATAAFPATASGNSYYVVIRGRNIVDTWSATPVAFTATAVFNLGSATQAFGSNLGTVGTTPVIYSGDFDASPFGDGLIDFFDYQVWDIDYSNFETGYKQSDLNGDGLVDFFDYAIWDLNYSNFIQVAKP